MMERSTGGLMYSDGVRWVGHVHLSQKMIVFDAGEGAFCSGQMCGDVVNMRLRSDCPIMGCCEYGGVYMYW